MSILHGERGRGVAALRRRLRVVAIVLPILVCRGGLVERKEGFGGGCCAEADVGLAKTQAFSRNLRTWDSIALPGTRNGLSVMSTEKLCAEMA